MKLGISRRYALWFSAITLIILSTVLLTTAIVIWRSSYVLRENLRQGTIQNFEAVQHATMYNLAEYLREELFPPLYDLDVERIDHSLQDLYKGMPIVSIRIADAAGKVLTDGTRTNPSYGMQLQLDRKELAATPVLIEQVKEGRRVTFQIGMTGYIAGYGEMIFSEAPLETAIERQDKTVLEIWRNFRQDFLEIAATWTILIAILTLVTGVIFSRTFSLPLITLRDATRRIAQGDLDNRVDISSRDEMGDLAAAFNQMVDDLKKRTSELARINEALQAEVEERKQAEQALRESEERLILAQKAGRVGVYDWDPANRKGIWTGIEELFGLDPGAFQGKYEEWAKRVDPDDLIRIETDLQRCTQEYLAYIEVEYRFIRADGQTRWMAGTGQIIYAADGTPCRIIGTVTDVTDLKESQLKLTAAKEAAEAANLAKSEFLANMSHEMRTPLAGALGMVNLVLEMEIGTEERQLLEMAKRSSESLLRLISDLLDFSRLEAGILIFEKKDFSLVETIRSAMEVVSLHAKEKGLHVSWQLEESVPEVMKGDQGRLRQVLVNLLGNSIKFTEQGEVEVTIRRFCDIDAPGRDFLLFSIRDTGIGIPHQETEKIFGKFIQVDSTSRRKYGGAGLGLALSRQIVEMMGGRIWVESQVGKGSTFRFTYPLERSK